MACLNDGNINLYIENGLRPVERSMVRDHLVVCSRCREKVERALFLEKTLRNPKMVEPPAAIERDVMRRIVSRVPTYGSVLALISASFVFLISWIYIYFDFANNSFIRALDMAGQSTSHWISSVITFISTIFTTVYALFRAISKLMDILFDLPVGVELLSLLVMLMTIAGIYLVHRWTSRRSRRQKA